MPIDISNFAKDDAATTGVGTLPLPSGDGSGATDTTAINNAIAVFTLLGVGKILGVQGGSYKINAPIVHSGVVLDFTGCTITLVAGSNCNMLTNPAAITAAATATDAQTTTGSNVVTTSLGASAVVGQTCIVQAAGVLATQPLVGLVSAKTPTTITLVKLDGATAMNAGQTIASGGSVALYTRDQNVRCVGGHWNAGNNAGAGTNLHIAHYRHVDGFTFDPESISSTASKYALSLADATQFWVRMRGLNVASDGCHLTGPLRNGRVEEVEGTTHDDCFAITANDWTAYANSSGDVTGISVGTLDATSTFASVCKIISGVGTTVDGIEIEAVLGAAALYGVWIGDDTGQAATTGGQYGSVKVERVDGSYTTNPVKLIGPSADLIDINVTARNSTVVPVSAANGGGSVTINRLRISGDFPGCTQHAIQLAASGITVQDMDVDDCYYTPTTTTALINIHGSTVQQLNVNRPRGQWTSNTGYLIYCDSGTLNRFVVNGGYLRLLDKVYIGYSGQPACTGHFTGGLHLLSCNDFAYTQAALNVVFGQCSIDTLNNQAVFVATGGSANVFGIPPVVVNGTLTLIGRTSTQTVRVNGPSLPVDVAILTPSDGDMAMNTNAANACGTGPATYNAAALHWKGLYSAATGP